MQKQRLKYTKLQFYLFYRNVKLGLSASGKNTVLTMFQNRMPKRKFRPERGNNMRLEKNT